MSWAAAIEKSTDLHELERIVEKGFGTFIEVGLAIARIREAKLYKATHPTWAAYCKERWGWSRQRAYQLEQGSKVAREVCQPEVDIPSERHARELARAPEGDRSTVMREATELAGGGAPKVVHIREAIERRAASTIAAPQGQLGFGVPGAPRRDLSQWDTRPETARKLVAWAGLKPKSRVLEPSAGKGNLVNALRDVGAKVTAVEIDPGRAIVLGAECADFLEYAAKLGPGDHFDAAVMNPPYENGQDLAHILAALRLAPRVFVLARLVLLEGQDRRKQLWDAHTLARLKIFSERESFEGDTDGTPRSAFAAFEIRRGPGRSIVEWF